MTIVAERSATETAAARAGAVITAVNPKRVDTAHPAYDRMKARYTLTRALMLGTEGIRELDRTVLPQLEGETDPQYAIRKQVAALHPGFEKAVEVGVGLLLQQEPTLDKAMVKPLVDFWEDVTGDGQHGVLFCDDLVTASMVDGIAGIMTDATRVDDPTLDRSQTSAAAVVGADLDAADAKALGLRAYWILVKADEILNPVYMTIGGVRTLVMFVRKSTATKHIEPFGSETVTRYTVYRRMRSAQGVYITASVWEQGEQEAEATEKGSPVTIKNLKTIPWAPLRGGQKISENETKPGLMGLAYLVVQYHQILSNMLSLEGLAMTPSMVRIGAVPVLQSDGTMAYPAVTLGPRNTIEAPAVEGVPTPIYWTSPDVSVLEPSDKSLTRTETQMGLASASFLAPEKRAAETEKSKQLAARAGNATLGGLGRRLQDCLETAFGHVRDIMGIESNIRVTVNLDFEDALMEADVMVAYVKLVEAGYPKLLAAEALQLGGRIKPDADLDKVIQEWELALEIKSENAAAQSNNTDPLTE